MSADLAILNPDTGDRLGLIPHQWDMVASQAFATFLAGGWGSGKSLALVAWLLIMAMSNPPGTRGMVIMPTFDMMDRFVNNVMLPALELFIRGHKVSRRTIYLPNGRQLLYRSGHDPSRVEMDNLCYVGLDEAGLMDRILFTKSVARVRDRRAKRLAVGLTGVPLYGWLKGEFDGKDNDKRRIIRAQTANNPHLHDDYVVNLREACPASQEAMYLRGEFVSPGSQVWPEFGEQNFVDWTYSRYVRRVDGTEVDTGLVVVIDWSPRHPKVLFAHKIPERVWVGSIVTERPVFVVVGELEPDGYDNPIQVFDLAQTIKHHCPFISRVIADAAGKAVRMTSIQSEAQQMQEGLNGMPIDFPPSYPGSVSDSIALVRLAFAPSIGHPRLFVSSALKENQHPRGLVNSIRAYTYAKDKDGNLSDIPRSDNLSEDACDDLRYLAAVELPSVELVARHYSGEKLHANIRR